VVFGDEVDGNPLASVEVKVAPDGTIVGRRLVKSSGVPAWDEAVLRAIDKTEVLPRDTDGRVPPAMLLDFRPRDF
jgi:colicin import membrane protein